jgi:cytochrome c oxidase assembly factor CtaG
MRAHALVVLLLLGSTTMALAHGGASHAHADWSFDPWIVMPLCVIGLLYLVGTAALWRRSGAGHGIALWRAASYAAGWIALAAALCSPLHQLGEHLFTFHMIEHEIVMAVAAPLVVLARPAIAALWALPVAARQLVARALRGRAVRTSWRALTRPGCATLLHGGAIWLWHVPGVFDAAVTTAWIHRVQHLSFFLTAVLFWWALVRINEYGIATWHLFVTMIHTSVLGALMALAPRVLYGVQTADAAQWGLTPLEDQQLAGMVMWVPAGTIYAGAALVFMALWISGAGGPTRPRAASEPPDLKPRHWARAA